MALTQAEKDKIRAEYNQREAAKYNAPAPAPAPTPAVTVKKTTVAAAPTPNAPAVNPYTGMALSATQQANLAKQKAQLGDQNFDKAIKASQESNIAKTAQQDMANMKAMKAGLPQTPTAPLPAVASAPRNPPTVATEQNPAILRGSYTSPMASGPIPDDQMLENIAIKKYKGEPLSEEEVKFQVKSAIGKYSGPQSPAKDVKPDMQGGYYRAKKGDTQHVPLPNIYASEEEFAAKDPQGYDRWADMNGYQYSFDDKNYYDSVPFSMSDYMNATPEQQLQMQNQAFTEYARQLAGITNEGFGAAEAALAGKEDRIGQQLTDEEAKLTAQNDEKLAAFKADEEARKAEAIAEANKSGAAREGSIKEIQSFSGFGRSTKTMELLSEASQDTQNLVADIERQSNRVVSDYQVSLLDKMDQKLQKYRDKLDATQDEKDNLKLQQAQAQISLATDLFKQSPMNPQNMMANAEKLKTEKLAEIKADKEEQEALKKAARENFQFMTNTFGSEFVGSMSPDELQNVSENMGIPMEVLKKLPKTLAEQQTEWEKQKYYGSQEFELQKMMYGNELDQANALTQFNRDLQKMGINHEFDIDTMNRKFNYDVDLVNFQEGLKQDKSLAKWSAIIGDVSNQYGQVAASGDTNALSFSQPITHPSTNTKVQSINVQLAQAYPDGFKFKASDGEGGLGGQCKWFAQKLTVLSNGQPWRAGSTLADTKANFEKYRKQGLGFKVGEKEAKVGQSVLSSDSLTAGHGYVINAITPEGKWVVTEANFKGPLTVSNSRVVDPNSPKIIGILDTVPRKEYQVPNKVLSVLAGASEKMLAGAPAGSPAGFPALLGKLAGAVGKTVENRMNTAIDAGKVEMDINAQKPQASPYADLIASNPFLKNVASGATKLSADDETELAQVSPQFYQAYQEAKSKSGGDKDFTQMNQLYQRVEPVIKQVRTLDEGFSYAQAYENIPQKDNYTDQSLIFSYMKVLDPGSVVRSDEFNTAMKNQGVLGSLGVTIDNINGKAMLNDTARAAILKVMREKYASQKSNYQRELEGQNKIFRDLGFDPALIYPQEFVFSGAGGQGANSEDAYIQSLGL